MAVEKKRESNIELFRVFMMLLIVAHHYVVNSGLLDAIEHAPFGFKSAFLLIFGAWGKVGINGFVLITGWYMCTSRITAKKFLKLLGEVVFYKLLIWLIFVALGVEGFGLGSLLRAALPVRLVSSDFVDCFLVFYLLIPFLNILISAMDQKRHLLLLVLLFGVYTVLGSFPLYISVTFNYVSWFAVIYLLGAYLRLYREEPKMGCGLRFLLSVLAASASVVGIAYLKARFSFSIARYFFVNDANKLLAVLPAVYAFRFFQGLRLGYRKLINIVASATFGVLLIHANSDAMRTWLWKTTLRNTEAFHQSWWLAHALLSVLAVYVVCTGIDLLRIYLLERPFFRWYERRKERFESAIRQKADRLLDRCVK